MSDYLSEILRVVAGLRPNTSENRQACYDRARAALVTQLREITPPVGALEILREQIKLENAIRRVEAGYSQHVPACKEGYATVTPIAPMPKLFRRSME
jgi:hypothetical protein